jgi:hypothetical protein
MRLSIIFIFTFFVSPTGCDECDRVQCLNGGECIRGECYCDDGALRPFCVLDSCLSENNCQNGHCEYGICICDGFWAGENCDVSTYIDHSGDYYGGFDCDGYYTESGIISVAKTSEPNVFLFREENYYYEYQTEFTSIDQFVISHQRAISGSQPVYVEGLEILLTRS